MPFRISKHTKKQTLEFCMYDGLHMYSPPSPPLAENQMVDPLKLFLITKVQHLIKLELQRIE